MGRFDEKGLALFLNERHKKRTSAANAPDSSQTHRFAADDCRLGADRPAQPAYNSDL